MSRARMARPFQLFCPCQFAPNLARSSALSGKFSLGAFSSCRHTTSGSHCASHPSRTVLPNCWACRSFGSGATLAQNEQIDFALLDVNLKQATSFPVANFLRERQIPFMFPTGDPSSITTEYADISVLDKPVSHLQLQIFLAIRRYRVMNSARRWKAEWIHGWSHHLVSNCDRSGRTTGFR